MRRKASVLFLTQLKRRSLWAVFIHCVCFRCLRDVTWNSSRPCLFLLWWHERKSHQPCLYSGSRVWVGKVADCVCTAGHVGCFQNKSVGADRKRSARALPDSRTGNRSAQVFFYACLSVTDSTCAPCLNLCVHVCSNIRWSFISSPQYRAGVRFTWPAVHQVCLDAFSLPRVSVQWILHLRWKEK